MRKVVIVVLMLVAGQAYAQKPMRDSLSNYTGIWMGFTFADTNTVKPKLQAPLLWRIHRIDTLKQEIELTQTGQRFDDASVIENPKKQIHKILVEPSGFSIELEGRLPNSKYRVHLSHSGMQDLKAMKGVFERSDQKETSTTFIFGKISDDVSDDIKPNGKVEVIITPPPPIK